MVISRNINADKELFMSYGEKFVLQREYCTFLKNVKWEIKESRYAASYEQKCIYVRFILKLEGKKVCTKTGQNRLLRFEIGSLTQSFFVVMQGRSDV